MDGLEYTEVFAAVVERNGKVLIARRKRPFRGYYWEFPGGKAEEGRTAEASLAGAVRASLGIAIEVREPICTARHDLNCQVGIILTAYRAAYVSGEFALEEHDEVRWVAPQELSRYGFADPDRHVVRLFLESPDP
jgi:8-oxo-dGTP diphosphatase